VNVRFLTKGDPRTRQSGGTRRTLAVLAVYASSAHRVVQVDVLDRFRGPIDPYGGAGPSVVSWRSRLLDLVVGFLRSGSVSVSRHYSAPLRRSLAQAGPAMLHVEFGQMVVNVPPGRPFVLDCHNIEHRLVAMRSEGATRAVARVLWRLEAAALRRFELRAMRRAERVTVCSEEDRARLLLDGIDAVVAENGSDQSAVRRDPARRVLFVGSVGWQPNHRGLLWFLADVWPLVRKGAPGAVLDIVGGPPRPELVAAAHAAGGVEVHGFVDDLQPFFVSANVSVVPLLEGSGSRIKIFESVAAGVPVVSTAIGAEGARLPDVEVADAPQELADLLIDALTHVRVVSEESQADVGWHRRVAPIIQVVDELHGVARELR
jgi:glycosyltransferase involved in cell wall biosynthesis